MRKAIMILIEDAEENVYERILSFIQKMNYQVETIKRGISEDKVLIFPGLRIECYRHRVYIGGTEVKLSAFEFKLLFQLASSPQRVFTKEQIYQNLYNEETGKDTDNSIYYLVKSVRKKLNDSPTEPKYIRTIRGVGYQFCGGEL